MNTATVTQNKLRSPLMEALRLQPRKGKRGKRKMAATLVLTSLVDAFTIMLLYLLIQGSGNGSTLELDKAEKLPTAIKLEALHNGTVVKIEGRRYWLDGQDVPAEQLAARLQQLKMTKSGDEAEAIIIQADRNVGFKELTPIIRAGSISGFHKFKFAVLQGDEGVK